jgi:dTDP-glucose 4,6-dehydratase
MNNIIVTGGAGFIGSNLVKELLRNPVNKVLIIDKLTYAGNLLSLKDVEKEKNYSFYETDICDIVEIRKIIFGFRPDKIMNLAAESHVDRSIDDPYQFIQTNIVGTYSLLKVGIEYFRSLNSEQKRSFRFLHVSTDEVFGSLNNEGFFTESSPYIPNSPYSASKASSDHLVRAWYHTYNFPVLVTNCSNNYGPYQFPEKFVPVIIMKALHEELIPIYGKGENIRDWLYVEDHVIGLIKVLFEGKIGETYVIGGNNERTNLELVEKICSILDKVKPRKNGHKYSQLVSFVEDRPGHDRRYAIDASKLKTELGFSPLYSFEMGIEKTINWYINNQNWCTSVLENKYKLERLGKI